jgi:hypothetical protein
MPNQNSDLKLPTWYDIFNPKERAMRILGLTGPVQNGKGELAPVFRELGWVFHDLNDVVYADREKGSERYRQYQTLFPGCLDDEGVETGIFYRSMNPELYRQFLIEDIPKVGRAALGYCAEALLEDQNIVLSWEYLARIQGLPLNHMLLFTSTPQRWYGRMKERAQQLGWKKIPADGELDRIIEMLDVAPTTIEYEVRACMSPHEITMLDVTPDDWGAERLRRFLLHFP